MSNLKAAWARIRERYEQQIGKLENGGATQRDPFFGFLIQPKIEVDAINDEIQAEYKSGRITEPERDAMREHVKVWLGDPKIHNDAVNWEGNDRGYDAYSCGLWAPSAKPWDKYEVTFVHMTIAILEEESA